MSSATDGLAFLQRTIEYVENVVYPGGKCVCGSHIDFTIEARLGVPAPFSIPPGVPPWQTPGTPQVISYIIECLACHRKHEVEASVLENFVLNAPPMPPPRPPVDVACEVCAKMVPDNTVFESNGKRVCTSCHEVQDKLGQIVDVQHDAVI